MSNIKPDSEMVLDICSHIIHYRQMYKDTGAQEFASDKRIWEEKLNDIITYFNKGLFCPSCESPLIHYAGDIYCSSGSCTFLTETPKQK